jgi:sterol desaturase/sphingolipid hydroxylase (fatty acid hydroxylase superfamily)
METLKLPLVGLLPLLVLFAGIEIWLGRRLRRGSFDWRESAASLAIALGQRVSGLASAGLIGGAYFWIWDHRLLTVPLDNFWAPPLLFVASEFCYYWQHRASHESRWFWASHAVHHSPRHLNFSAAYRLGWTAGFTGTGLFFVPLVLLGFHPLAVGAALALNLTYQFWLHTELIPKLGVLEWPFNTPSHHRVHHASNPEYLDANYGGVLIVFDRLFGTFVDERADIVSRYGLVKPLESHNPLRIAFHEWLAMARDLATASSWGERAAYAFGPPGWRPGDPGAMPAMLPRAAARSATLK